MTNTPYSENLTFPTINHTALKNAPGNVASTRLGQYSKPDIKQKKLVAVDRNLVLEQSLLKLFKNKLALSVAKFLGV